MVYIVYDLQWHFVASQLEDNNNNYDAQVVVLMRFKSRLDEDKTSTRHSCT